MVIIKFNNQRAVTINLVLTPQARLRFAVRSFSDIPQERAFSEQCLPLGKHEVNKQSLNHYSASVAWEYLINDAQMGIFRAIVFTSGLLDGWMVSQFC